VKTVNGCKFTASNGFCGFLGFLLHFYGRIITTLTLFTTGIYGFYSCKFIASTTVNFSPLTNCHTMHITRNKLECSALAERSTLIHLSMSTANFLVGAFGNDR